MARQRKTIMDAVAGSVTDAVTTAIDAIAHPVRTATGAGKATGRTVRQARRTVTKAARGAASKTKRKAAKKVSKKAAGRRKHH
jgi:hypothetical protein